MQEDTDLPYKPVHSGRAHECGLDGHTAVLMGVAKMLAEARSSPSANVRLLFQPAEEGVRGGGGGAKVMVAEGSGGPGKPDDLRLSELTLQLG